MWPTCSTDGASAFEFAQTADAWVHLIGCIRYVEKVVMRQFHGLDNVDDKTRKALLSFSYFLAVGNMDEAYKAVKQIKNPDVWENMVHMASAPDAAVLSNTQQVTALPLRGFVDW